MLFESWEALLRVAAMTVAAYFWLILVLRVAGKRSLAKLNAFDFAVTVAFGSVLASVILSKDVPLADGMVAFAMLALLQYAISRGSVRWGAVKRAVRSNPRLLVKDGQLREAAMIAERVTRGEVEAAIRKQGIGRIEEVAALVMETDGSSRRAATAR
ncbi:MAG TPA: YetF domain-containing protein [Allosphingosinicella sp.]|nr:YetF domain-containing protein [Allosphingosinicella sp.]